MTQVKTLKNQGALNNLEDKTITALEEQVKKLETSLQKEAKVKFSELDKYIKSTAETLKATGEMLGSFPGDAGDKLNQVSEGISVTGEIAENASDIAGGILQMGTSPISGAMSIVKGVSGIIKGIGSRIKENKEVLRKYIESQNTEFTKELEYNKILRERAKIVKEIEESSESYYKRLEQHILQKTKDSNNEYQQILAKLKQEEYVERTEYRHGTWFRKAKTWDVMGSLSEFNDFEDFEQLDQLGKLQGNAKILYDQLKSLHEKQISLEEELKNLREQLKEEWTGTTIDNILSSITDGFKDGRKSAQDFADDFEDMMRKAILQAIKLKYLETPLEQWYESFAAASEGGLTAEKIADLREQYEKIIQNASKELDMMEH